MSKEIKQATVPRLRFQEFGNFRDWVEYKFIDVIKESNLRNQKSYFNPSQLRAVNKNLGMILMKDRVKGKAVDRCKIVKKDWFAYNPMRLNIGSICKWENSEPCIVSPDYVVFSCNENLLSHDFLSQFIQSSKWKNYVENEGRGSVRVRLYLKDLEFLKINLPSLPEQQKIADCLSLLDEVIAAQSEKVEALKKHKKGLLQQLFPQDRQTVPQLRFSEFRIKTKWEKETIGKLFIERQETGHESLRLLSLTDKDGVIPQENSNRKNNSNSDKSKYLRVCPGDIVYNTMRMWEGRSALVSMEGLVSPAYTVCQPNNQVSGDFFKYYFKTEQLITQFRKYSQGLVKDTLNLKFLAFSKIPILKPSLPEQQKIADCLSSLDEVIMNQFEILKSIKFYKKGLLQQLFPSLMEDENE